MEKSYSRSESSVKLAAVLGSKSMAITDAPDIMELIDEVDIGEEEIADIQGVRVAMLRGDSISYLIDAYPHQILRVIRQDGVHFLGDMVVEDSVVLAAFGNNVMLTRGMDEKDDPNWRGNWMSRIKELASKASPKLGWCKPVRLSAYVVGIKNAACPKDDGLLHPLLLNVKAGAVDPGVMGLPVVRAILNYKWNMWARNTLMAETALYLGWMVSFFFFTLFFRAQGPPAWNKEELMTNGWGSAAALCNFLSMAFMLPFFVIEVKTMWTYRLAWISLWNIIDMSTYTLQTITFIAYYASSEYLGTHYFSLALAAESVLIFLRSQFFFRAFSAVRMSFVDLMAVVLHKAFFFIIFLFTTLMSFAVAFHMLYRNLGRDSDHDISEASSHFENLWKAFTTVFGMMLGGFEYDMLFVGEGSLPILTSAFFVAFQTLVAITCLNVLIAIMTEVYLRVMEQEQLYRETSRAQVIDELEMSLPTCLLKNKTHAYVHFLVVKNKKRRVMRTDDLTGAESLESLFNKPQNSLLSLPSLKSSEIEGKYLDLLAEKVAARINKTVDAVHLQETPLETNPSLDKTR